MRRREEREGSQAGRGRDERGGGRKGVTFDEVCLGLVAVRATSQTRTSSLRTRNDSCVCSCWLTARVLTYRLP